jgi:hypothetical protein
MEPKKERPLRGAAKTSEARTPANKTRKIIQQDDFFDNCT